MYGSQKVCSCTSPIFPQKCKPIYYCGLMDRLLQLFNVLTLSVTKRMMTHSMGWTCWVSGLPHTSWSDWMSVLSCHFGICRCAPPLECACAHRSLSRACYASCHAKFLLTQQSSPIAVVILAFSSRKCLELHRNLIALLRYRLRYGHSKLLLLSLRACRSMRAHSTAELR